MRWGTARAGAAATGRPCATYAPGARGGIGPKIPVDVLASALDTLERHEVSGQFIELLACELLHLTVPALWVKRGQDFFQFPRPTVV